MEFKALKIKSIRTIALIFIHGSALSITPAMAATTVTPRTDHVLSLQGSLDPSIKVSFGEVFYLAANLLDPSCLLRYPNGEYGLISESVVIDPIEHANGAFKIEMPMNRYNGTDACQFQFGFIKLWLKKSNPSATDKAGGYVVFAKMGSVLGNIPTTAANYIDTLSCAEMPTGLPENQDLDCAFFNAQGKRIFVGVPVTGQVIKLH